MEYLKGLVGVLWLINIILLVTYIILEEADGWNVLALIGVTLTGLVPILFRKSEDRDGWAAFVHVISGVIGTAASGLALGYVTQCNKSFENVPIMITAAVINAISGIVAHIAFIPKKSLDDDDRGVAGSSYFKRGQWYLSIATISLIALLGHLYTYSTENFNEYPIVCDSQSHHMYYFISPIVHTVAFIILWFTIESEYFQYFNYIILNIAGVLSMFGANISGFWGDVFIAVLVYIFLALAHLL